jgi:hypothetical protein
VGRFWLDADVLIQAANGLFSFRIAAPFWSFLDEQVRIARVSSSTKIYAEIVQRGDDKEELTRWVKTRRTAGIFISPKREVQESYSEIADHVMQKYSRRRAKAAEFLSGGDGWIIAHAKCDSGIVVSHETRVDKASLTPKIPNVCTDFGVGCIGLADMLDQLNFKFAK